MFGDELFKAGLISKKDLRKARQEAKKERRQKQGNRKKKSVIKAEEKARRQAEAEAQQAQQSIERQEREKIQEQRERLQQIQQIIRQNQVVMRRDNLSFWHPSVDGKHVHKLYVSEAVAKGLRAGQFGIAVLGSMSASDPIYVVISRAAVMRILEIDSTRILFWNEEPPPDTPDMQLFHTYFQ